MNTQDSNNSNFETDNHTTRFSEIIKGIAKINASPSTVETQDNNELAISNINRHNFEVAKRALEKYKELEQGNKRLSTVSLYDGKIFQRDHAVIGLEFNHLIDELQDQFIAISKMQNGMIGEFKHVYDALEALDKDYINNILDSIKAIKVVNDKTVNNQKCIDDTVYNQGLIIEALKNFKEDISTLQHLMDVDKAWARIEEQDKRLQSWTNYRQKLEQIKHLMEIDGLWQDNIKVQEQLKTINASINKASNSQKEFEKRLSSWQRSLSSFKHFSDIDSMWSDTHNLKATIDAYKKDLDAIIKDVEELRRSLDSIVQSQQEGFAILSQAMDDYQASIDGQVAELKSSQRNTFAEMNQALDERQASVDIQIADLRHSQEDSFAEIKQALDDRQATLDVQVAELKRFQQNTFTEMNQALDERQATVDIQIAELKKSQQNTFEEMNRTLNESQSTVDNQVAEIKSSQQDTFAAMNQAMDARQAVLDKQVEELNRSQVIQFDLINQALEVEKQEFCNQLDSFEKTQQESAEKLMQSLAEEKSALDTKLISVTKKLKTAYFIAGSTAAITVIHIVLNILGIL